MKQWVVDTWVLAKSNDADCADCIDCMDFLMHVLREGKLCLDFEEEIKAEYDRHIKPRTPIFWWWQKMIGQAGHLCFWSNKLSVKHENRLVNKLKFDNDDIKFVGVASRSTDKIIATGDSDYNQKVCEYLGDNLGITVMNPNSALEM